MRSKYEVNFACYIHTEIYKEFPANSITKRASLSK